MRKRACTRAISGRDVINALHVGAPRYTECTATVLFHGYVKLSTISGGNDKFTHKRGDQPSCRINFPVFFPYFRSRSRERYLLLARESGANAPFRWEIFNDFCTNFGTFRCCYRSRVRR